MFVPIFPYKNNQIILSSDRIVLHAKKDAIFLFGKQAVSLSSSNTINLDSKKEIYLSSPNVFLGDMSINSSFQPMVLGTDFINDMVEFYLALKNLTDQLSHINETNFAAFATSVRTPANVLSATLNKKILNASNLLSKNVFIK